MFKHVIRKKEAGSDVGSSAGSSSDSDVDDRQFGEDEGEEFAGFGDEDEDDDDGEEEDEEARFGERVEQEDLPEHLPSLLKAVTAPVFELSQDATGRKTLVCVMCPDKVLREGSMRDVHESSKSHKRRLQRYASYIKQNPGLEEETLDPRAITAFLDKQLRIRKSGGAGFTIEPSGKRRKKHRKNKKEKKDEEDGKKEGENPNGPPAGDGIEEVSGMTAMNAKQKRKQKQQQEAGVAAQRGRENKGDGEDSKAMLKGAGQKQAASMNAPNGAAKIDKASFKKRKPDGRSAAASSRPGRPASGPTKKQKRA